MKTVLIVEDNPLMLELYRGCLTPLGLSLAAARDGEEALRMLDQTRFDLLLVDINLPRMSGFDLIGAARSRPGLKHVPALAVTTTTAEAARLKLAGFNHVMRKPVAVEQLVAAVRGLLGL